MKNCKYCNCNSLISISNWDEKAFACPSCFTRIYANYIVFVFSGYCLEISLIRKTSTIYKSYNSNILINNYFDNADWHHILTLNYIPDNLTLSYAKSFIDRMAILNLFY